MQILSRQASVTIEVVVISMALGTIVGLFAGLAKLSGSRTLRGISSVYVQLWRGTPLLVQLLWIYFGLPLVLGINFSPKVAGCFGLSLWAGAYLSELFRGGIVSIPLTQRNAGYTLGMTFTQVTTRIVLPQAFQRILPPYISQLIQVVKYSALLSVIGVFEITRRAETLVTATFRPFEVYMATAMVYFVILFALAQLGKYAEKRLRVNVLE